MQICANQINTGFQETGKSRIKLGGMAIYSISVYSVDKAAKKHKNLFFQENIPFVQVINIDFAPNKHVYSVDKEIEKCSPTCLLSRQDWRVTCLLSRQPNKKYYLTLFVEKRFVQQAKSAANTQRN